MIYGPAADEAWGQLNKNPLIPVTDDAALALFGGAACF
jgi:hypothetical protein